VGLYLHFPVCVHVVIRTYLNIAINYTAKWDDWHVILSERDVILSAVLLIKTENKLLSVLVNNTSDKMTSRCDKTDVAQTNTRWNKITPFDLTLQNLN
jgi:hypothetical protein